MSSGEWNLALHQIRKNARARWKKGNILRNLSAISQKNDLQKWKDSVSYRQRWIVETIFSTMKRMFGEYVYSVKFDNMVKEMTLKTSLYNKMISIWTKQMIRSGILIIMQQSSRLY
jgi:hypothetical protein